MQKRGKTAAGVQRWLCVTCNKSGVRTRADVRIRHLRTHFVRWLTGVASLAAIARSMDRSRQHIPKCFESFWGGKPPQPPAYEGADTVLIFDGVYLSGRANAALVARTPLAVCSWHFAERECFDAWDAFLNSLPAPAVVVIDGQKGLFEAVLKRFPQARIQRCLVHVERFVRMCLSMRPKTAAGRELWRLIRSLWDVRTREAAEDWRRRFLSWERYYDSFLKERSRSPETGRWWYTHRKLRAARSHIKNALPYLFTFTEIPDVPRTTNHVEGGINSRLKELVRRHRGLSPERKQVLAAHFLASKMVQKPPREFT